MALSCSVSPGEAISRAGKPIGKVTTCAGLEAIAYLRFDQTGEGMTAGAAEVRLI